MHIHPALDRLRHDSAQLTGTFSVVRKAHKEWLASSVMRDLSQDFKAYSEGQPLSRAPTLLKLMTDITAARDLVHALVDEFVTALRTRPFAELPFRQSASEGFGQLQILRRKGAVLRLCVYEPLASSDCPKSARFSDCEVAEIIVSGEAEGFFADRREEADGEHTLHFRDQLWRAGDRIVRQPLVQARHFVTVSQSLLVVQLTREPEKPRPTCEYRLSDGVLVGQTSAYRVASEQFMALSVLGALGHRKGINAICAFSLDSSHDPDARWEALRQTLVMDAARGFALLQAIAEDPADYLSSPARDLLKQLLDEHPALAPEPAMVR